MDDEVTLRFTEKEAKLVAALAMDRVRADSGDRKAKARMAGLARQVKSLTARARRGNAKAKRLLQVLQASGILEQSQVFAMEGALSPYPWIWSAPWSWHVGKVNVFNVGLLVTAGFFAWRRRWLPAAGAAGVLAVGLANGSRFVDP